MFYYIQGIVAHVAPYLAVLDCSGVGYACKTTNHTLAALTRGKSAKLYTHLYVREEIMELYGFISESELNCFEMLIGVSGVGPKAALAILSSNTPEGLATAIVSGNEKALTSAPGIGKKIAQRAERQAGQGSAYRLRRRGFCRRYDHYSRGQDQRGRRRPGGVGVQPAGNRSSLQRA